MWVPDSLTMFAEASQKTAGPLAQARHGAGTPRLGPADTTAQLPCFPVTTTVCIYS